MHTALIVIVFLANACLVEAGIYLSAYLKKKAEGLATKEEFKDLREQTAELTRTTKNIEAEINSGIWDRQKRWELKRDVLFEATRRVATAFDALKKLDNVLQTELRHPSVKNLAWSQVNIDENNKWFRAKADLDESQLFLGVTCGKEVTDRIIQFNHLTTTIAAKINKEDGEIFKKSVSQVFDLNEAISNAVRKELAIDDGAGPGAKSLSTGSSAVQTPAEPSR